MANLDLLNNLDWIVRDKPTSGLTPEWENIVLPGRDFTIIYKITVPPTPEDEEEIGAEYSLADFPVLYQAEEQPIAVADLLTSIYEFYQEPLLKTDPFYKAIKVTKRGQALFDEALFAGLEEVSPDTYAIQLDPI